MTTKQEITDRVEADIEVGFATHLKKVSFDPVGPFAEQAALVEGSFAAVQWRFVGVDCENGFSMWNTGKPIEVLGVTIVDMSGEQWLFNRHVDWNAVNAQLGGSRGRSAAPVDQARDFKTARLIAAQCYEAEMENLCS